MLLLRMHKAIVCGTQRVPVPLLHSILPSQVHSGHWPGDLMSLVLISLCSECKIAFVADGGMLMYSACATLSLCRFGNSLTVTVEGKYMGT